MVMTDEDDDETLLDGSVASRKPASDASSSSSSSPSSSSSLPLDFRTRFSDLSESLQRGRREAQRDDDDDDDDDYNPEPRREETRGLTAVQAGKMLVEMAKLNEELSAVVVNLKARQEESDHIHDLLIERAERAAQRIIFLQTRISSLEQELRENDDELQHLRICLKAAEMQLPPHPDQELQRCIAVFKNDYHSLRRKRATRPAAASTSL